MTMTPPPSPLPAPAPANPMLGDVVARIGADVAAPLTAALDRVVAFASTGRIDRMGLQALRNEIDGARRVGLRSQQIARLAGGQVRQSAERLDLAHCLRGVLAGQVAHRHGDAVAVPAAPTRAEVLCDASLLHTLLDAAASWSGALACEPVSWRIDVQPWPVRARVVCRLSRRPADLASAPAADDRHELPLDTLDWLLMRYAAHLAGVQVQRHDSPSHTELTLEFLTTINGTLEDAAAVDRGASTDGSAGSIAGCQLLVLSAQRQTRQRLREAVQGRDLLIDHVSTLTDAALYCQDGAPHALLFESAFQGDALSALLADLGRSAPAMALVELLPAGHHGERRADGSNPVHRMGIDVLPDRLVSVLLSALGRAGGA